MKLNIGCGNDKRAGYINIDVRSEVNPDLCYDVEKYLLSFFPNDSIDEILAIDFIEHLSFNKVELFLKDCFRVLKKGGVLKIQIPNLQLHFRNSLDGKYSWKELSYWIYGGQDNPFNYHKSGFLEHQFIKLLESVGFKVIKKEYIHVNIYFEAVKP